MSITDIQFATDHCRRERAPGVIRGFSPRELFLTPHN